MSAMLRSFRDDFAERVRTAPDAPAFITRSDVSSQTLSYAEVADLVDRCRAFYVSRGMQPDDVVLALMPNAADTLVAWLATISSGYGFAPLPCTATPPEVKRWLELVDPRLVIVTSLVQDDVIEVLRASGRDIELVETDGRFAWLPEERGGPDGDAPRTYLATSGTTGDPQALVLDSNRLWSAGCAFLAWHGLDDPSLRFWNYLPMSYLGGLFNLGLIPLAAGGSVVLDEPFSGKTFLGFWQTVERFEINVLWLVPSILRGLLGFLERAAAQGQPTAAEGVRAIFLGTAPIDLAAKQRFEELVGVPALENFALSETTFFSSERAGNLESRTEGSVGEILPYTEVRLRDAEGDDGEAPQEICVRSPFLFLGYLEGGGALDARLDGDGFLPTGDLGTITEDGILTVTGRSRDIIKKGGYMVALREIEREAREHEHVAEAAAVQVPHDFYGESYVLCVVPAAGAPEDAAEDVARRLRERLVRYKWPERVQVVAELPRGPSGKVRKHLIDLEAS